MMSSGSTFRLFSESLPFTRSDQIRRFTVTVVVVLVGQAGQLIIKSAWNTCSSSLGSLGVNNKALARRSTPYCLWMLLPIHCQPQCFCCCSDSANSLLLLLLLLRRLLHYYWVVRWWFHSLDIFYYCCRRSRSLGFIYLLLCAAHEHNPSAHHCQLRNDPKARCTAIVDLLVQILIPCLTRIVENLFLVSL